MESPCAHARAIDRDDLTLPESPRERHREFSGPLYVIVPEPAYRTGAHATVTALYSCLAKYASKHDGAAWPAQTTLAKDMGGVSTRTINRAAHALQDAALIAVTRVHRQGRTHNTYKLTRNPAWAFVQLPVSVLTLLKDGPLTASQLLAWIRWRALCGRTGQTTSGASFFASRFSVHAQTAARLRDQLRQTGLLDISERPGHTPVVCVPAPLRLPPQEPERAHGHNPRGSATPAADVRSPHVFVSDHPKPTCHPNQMSQNQTSENNDSWAPSHGDPKSDHSRAHDVSCVREAANRDGTSARVGDPGRQTWDPPDDAHPMPDDFRARVRTLRRPSHIPTGLPVANSPG